MFKRGSRISAYFIIILATIASTFLLWLPFLFKWPSIGHLRLELPLSLLDLYRHWDGFLYIIVAKTWYNPESMLLKYSILGMSANYFPAHFPLYPVLIATLAPLFGYLKSVLVIPVMFAIAYACLFFRLVKDFKLTAKPLWLALVALFFTPRFFVVRSVPAPETVFLFFILASVYFFLHKRYFYASLLGSLAIITRSPGILLFVGYALFFAEKAVKEKKIRLVCWPLLLMPFALLGVFSFYYLQTGDFWAYFHSGDNIHLLFPPFQVFNQKATWVATGWLEDVLFIYLFYLLVLFNLYRQSKLRPIFWFMLVYFFAIISVEHKDISRYSLPMLPFGLITFEKFFSSKKFLLALLLLLPALYFYAWNFLLHNVAPITDWQFFW